MEALSGGLYYSSSQFNSNSAYYSAESPCGTYGGDRSKTFNMTVRAVRSF